MDGGAWKAAVHGVAEGRTRLNDFTLTFHFHALEKEMATHSSVLAWEIPWTEESGGLQSMGLQRVGRDLETKQLQCILPWGPMESGLLFLHPHSTVKPQLIFNQ